MRAGGTGGSPLEAVLRRDRALVLGSLVLVVVLSWGWLLAGAGTGISAFQMTGTISSSAGPEQGTLAEDHSSEGAVLAARVSGVADMALQPASWDIGYVIMMVLMWFIMMVAMMLPSAAPMILLFATVNRKQARPRLYQRTLIFAAAYLLVWAGFSGIATAAQWGLERAGLVGGTMATTSALLGGSILLAAGLWQLTPVKQACLRRCQLPIFFITQHWRPGSAGALRMGLAHGGYCLGCCWFLMALLFVGGVMNLVWIGGLALFVLAEKVVPPGHWLTRTSGILLILGGVGLLTAAL